MALTNNCSLESPCRLCAGLCNRDIGHLFSDDNKYLVHLISKYLSIKIAMNDTLPIQVCEPCRMQMISFDEYALKCSTTQISLSSLAQRYKEIKVVNPFMEAVKEEFNADIKHEIIDYASIKSEADNTCSDDNYIVAKSTKRKYKKKTHSIKTKDKKSKSKSLGAKTKTLKVISSEVNINLCDIEIGTDKIDVPRKPKSNSALNSPLINFDCHICNDQFSQWHILRKHTNHIHKVKPKVLCLCNKYLGSIKTIYRHIKKHDSNSCHKCTLCKSTFFSEKRLSEHMSNHENNPVCEYKCDQCDKSFAKIYFLKRHVKYHAPREERFIHSCGICEIKFGTKYAVQGHIKAVHEKDRPFVCDICGKSFNLKLNLKNHILSHGDERPFACPHCPKTYKSSSGLKRHTDVHDGIIYKCTKCTSSFTYKKTLREHMYMHIDTCRFICSFCNKGFKWKKSFDAHLNNHTGKTPFECPWCPKAFADSSNCRIHKRKTHPVELAEYEARNGISSKKVASLAPIKIRSIQFDEVVKSQIFPKIANLNPPNSDSYSE